MIERESILTMLTASYMRDRTDHRPEHDFIPGHYFPVDDVPTGQFPNYNLPVKDVSTEDFPTDSGDVPNSDAIDT